MTAVRARTAGLPSVIGRQAPPYGRGGARYGTTVRERHGAGHVVFRCVGARDVMCGYVGERYAPTDPLRTEAVTQRYRPRESAHTPDVRHVNGD
ncbi:hypothetical protein GCM10010339_42360 [Streptomyces alanosinicus]|uniref:Uncharacterized protein n=1 Tax=Streptomyces alanosinicus TaxID=68171 RepID=A0A918YJ02_9ACTN|nr:hypothetical protein GCM10010339_42360 [Streptomyces alanosinicus]